MRKVKNGKCIRNISTKTMQANRKRNGILLIAITLTSVLLTTLFTVTSSIIQSIEQNTMYQVGTRYHGGFKYITEEEFEELKTDPKIQNLGYTIVIGELENEEFLEDNTEIRYTTKENAKNSFVYPTTGRLPEKGNEIATSTRVLDDFHLPHQLGVQLPLQINNGFETYEGNFTVCGFWENPAEIVINQIMVSKEFQESFAPTWKNKEEQAKFFAINSFAGSINPGFYFPTRMDLEKQMDALKERHGFGSDVNEGINWAYSTSEVDFTSVVIVAFLLFMIIGSGYLIIYNIFLISVSADIQSYGLLKTVGTTNKQLKKIVLKQANALCIIAIPLGLLVGYLLSLWVLPFVTKSIMDSQYEVFANPFIFVCSALFSWGTVRVSCAKPCKMIKKIAPVEAVRYTDVTVTKLAKERKSKKVTPFSMAWENLKRNKRKTTAVVLSLFLSILMINVTVSITSCFDQNLYIAYFAATDFSVTDRSLVNHGNEWNLSGISFADMEAFRSLSFQKKSGAIYMSETMQKMADVPLERMKKVYEEHQDWFVRDSMQKEWIDRLVYEENTVHSHLYGVDALPYEKMEIDAGGLDWERFQTGKYVIISSFVDGTDHDEDYAYYKIGEKIPVEFPNGTVQEYEVMAIGDLSYAMGPQHSHEWDMNIILPAKEYLQNVPDAEGAMKYVFDMEEGHLEEAESFVSQYCEEVRPELFYTSRKTYLSDFQDMVNMFLIMGGALSLILALIGGLNFFNLTYTSIHERRQEFKTLHAVGMTQKQLQQMLIGEGLYRIGITFGLIFTVGLGLNYVLVNLIAGEMWMFRYHFVAWPMAACIPLFLLIAYWIPKELIKKEQAN